MSTDKPKEIVIDEVEDVGDCAPLDAKPSVLADGQRMVTNEQLCEMIGHIIEGNLMRLTGTKEGEGPAFSLFMWADDNPNVSYSCNRNREELAQRIMGALTTLAHQEPEPPAPKLTVVSH